MCIIITCTVRFAFRLSPAPLSQGSHKGSAPHHPCDVSSPGIERIDSGSRPEAVRLTPSVARPEYFTLRKYAKTNESI